MSNLPERCGTEKPADVPGRGESARLVGTAQSMARRLVVDSPQQAR